jgi:hypothetical protein
MSMNEVKKQNAEKNEGPCENRRRERKRGTGTGSID